MEKLMLLCLGIFLFGRTAKQSLKSVMKPIFIL